MKEPASPKPLSLYLVAAEESGDVLGGALARALTAAGDGRLHLAGVGGRAMAAAGIASPFGIEDLSIIGVTTIPRRLPLILRRIRETAEAAIAARPDALVIIDSPDFTHRVARRVRQLAPAIPIIDYVSPSVWAWRPGRSRAMRDYVDCVLAILPFEPAAHARLGGPPCVYVGHPLSEQVADLRSRDGDARRQNGPPLILVLPGSRSGEIRRMAPAFGAAMAKVAAAIPSLEIVLPTVPHLIDLVRKEVARWPVRPRIVVQTADKWAAFRDARAALAASGTVTLELALAGVPTIAAYRVPLIEELIFRLSGARDRLTTIILANLVLGENIVPEFLQRDCTPEKLSAALIPLVQDGSGRRRQIEAFARLDAIMGIGTTSPSRQAAAIVLDMARKGRQPGASSGRSCMGQERIG